MQKGLFSANPFCFTGLPLISDKFESIQFAKTHDSRALIPARSGFVSFEIQIRHITWVKKGRMTQN